MPVALVTGGASGIGLGVVDHLIKHDYRVCVMDQNESLQDSLVARFGDKIMFHGGNVVKYEDQAEAFRRVWEKWGQLDFVFANAGIGDRDDFYAPFEGSGSPPRPDTLVLDICVYGVVWTAFLSLHYFRKNVRKGGMLVMTSSIAGLYPAGSVPLYGLAKHGVIGLGRSLSQRLQSANEAISVHVVCPCFVATPLVSQRLAEVVPQAMLTPVSTIVRAISNFLQEPGKTGLVAECAGEDVIYRPVLPYGNKQTQYWAEGEYTTLIDPDEILKDSIERGKLLSKI